MSSDDYLAEGARIDTDVVDTAARYAVAIAATDLHPDGFITVDTEGRIDYVNGRAETICGVRNADLRGRPLGEALPFQDMTGRSWWELADPWRTLAITKGHREQMLMLPNGKVVLVTARYLRDEHGRILSVLLALRDAAGRMRSERELAGLVTATAHELKSPIANITGFMGSLLRHWDRFSDDDKQIMIRTIEQDAARVSRLVTDLLDVSRIENSSLTIRPTPIDVAAALEGHVTRRVAGGLPRDRFVLEIEDGLPELLADRDRFEQIVTNLVDNAITHGTGEVGLRARTEERDGRRWLRLCVCDQGTGIPEENRELVFSRYWQGGAKAGAGIGLFLVRGFVRAHGGTIELGERDGGGARVTVRLPAG